MANKGGQNDKDLKYLLAPKEMIQKDIDEKKRSKDQQDRLDIVSGVFDLKKFESNW